MPPSCVSGGAGVSNCGPDGGPESCCTSSEVTGGTYYRTYSSDDAGAPTGDADPAGVSGLRLDKYLVTVGRFRQFVDAVYPDGGASSDDAGLAWTPDAGSGKHWHLNGGLGLASAPNVDAGQTYEPGWVGSDDQYIAPTNGNLACGVATTWTNTAGTQENLPINCVTWQEAYAFCIWDGAFLPSDSEGGYAAAGGSEQLEYPWGTAAPGTSNQYAIYNSYYTGNSTGVAPVGFASLGAGRWGQLDLAGDLIEWNLDWVASYADPCTDCVQLNSSSTNNRVLRGGDFVTGASGLLSPNRSGGPPADRQAYIGFRCARTP
jgi:formylglycine-generating enzyme required for sulfatase activity